MNEFIIELFTKLHLKNINYAILRNYEDLPEKDHTTKYFDLDLIVQANQYKEFFRILIKISSKHNFNLAKKLTREYVKTTQLYRIEKNGFINSIQIDAHTLGQNWWGNYYLFEENILKNKFLFNNFYVVSKFHQNLFNWLDKLFWGNYVKNKYTTEILSVFNKNIISLNIFLSKIFGRKLSNQLINFIKKGELEKTLFLRKKMINKLRIYAFLNFPFTTIKSTFLFFYFELILRLFPPGLCVIFPISKKDMCYELFNKFKLLLVSSQVILNYEGKTKLEWLTFYLVYVFPIVRKSGLVFVLSRERRHIPKDNIIDANKVNNSLIKYLIKSYSKIHLPFYANTIIK